MARRAVKSKIASTIEFDANNDFFALLEGNSKDAIRLAERYLMRGVGEYHPNPPLRGVDTIIVQCERRFGSQASSHAEQCLEFHQAWERPAQRERLLQTLGLPGRVDRTFALQCYLKSSLRKQQNDQASSTYIVTFRGTAGVWSTRLVVGCLSFSAGAAVCSEDQTSPVEEFDDERDDWR